MTHLRTTRTRRKNYDSLWETVDDLIAFSVSIGAVWVQAWIWNPNLTSGTVTFIGGVVGSLVVINRNTPKETP